MNYLAYLQFFVACHMTDFDSFKFTLDKTVWLLKTIFCTNWLLAIVMNAYFPISKVLEASYYYVLATLSYKLIGQLVFVFCYVGLAVLFLPSYALCFLCYYYAVPVLPFACYNFRSLGYLSCDLWECSVIGLCSWLLCMEHWYAAVLVRNLIVVLLILPPCFALNKCI